MKTFGQTLIEIREQKGISQRKLAELLGITPTRLNYWEKDKRQPDIEMIQNIAKALSTEPNLLLSWNDFDRRFPNAGNESKECEAFDSYLNSLGYSVDSEVVRWHQEDVVENGAVIGQAPVEDERCFIVSIPNSTAQATFTKEEFAALRKQNKASIDGAILLQSMKKEPPSAATENGLDKD